MPLTPGQHLTHYELLDPLGAGGMGEVWRARDTRLGREVAIKVLPEELADDEERLRRFEREARTLASLNHPNVAGIHGVDQVEDVCLLALELVPGEDLAAKLARGPLPLDEAVETCRQLAEGLEAAHEAGVVHRDLKPANVRVTPEGVVKILDFGLAKPLRPRAQGGSGTTGVAAAESDSFLMTEEGLVLGTPTYMSPEQARGKLVDRRTDVWAFGCVLYECLTGRRAFAGATFPDVLAAIVGAEPDWARLPRGVPAHVVRLLERCLEKDPRERLRDVGEARIALARGAEEPVGVPGPAPRPGWLRTLAVGLPALALGALGAWLAAPDGGGADPAARPETRRSLRLTLPSPGLRQGVEVMAPDGRGIAFAREDWLWLHDFAAPEPTRIPGTEGVDAFLAWSADGTTVAFRRDGWLETLRLGERRAERRCALPENMISCTWADDGGFLLESGGKSVGLSYLAPDAEEPTLLDWLDPTTLTVPHRYNPAFLPGGDRFLLLDSSSGESWVHLASLSARTSEPLVRSANKARYVAPGWLAWADQASLYVQPFDAATGRLDGSPRELAQDVSCFTSTGGATFSFSAEGTLVYEPIEEANRLEWLDRQGRVLGRVTEDQAFGEVRLDPSGRWLAAAIRTPRTGMRDLWLIDLERETSRPLTDALGWEGSPVWSPDGRRLAFAADWSGPPNVHVLEIDGGRPQELVPFDNRVQYSGSWSADGRWVLYMSRGTASRSADLWRVDVETREREELRATPADEWMPLASPDGRWLAFLSNESGRFEVYVGTYPDLEGLRRVSSGGGTNARWKADSSELYYLTADEAIASSAIREVDGLPDPGAEEVVIQAADDLSAYDMTPDAERFLVVRESEQQARPVLHLLVGWEGLLE